MITINFNGPQNKLTNQPWYPSVHAVVIKDGAVLLHRREDHTSWALPGGKIEPGESIVDCLRRELVEETGLLIEPVRLLGIYSSPTYTLSAGDAVFQPFLVVFLCHINGGTLTTGPESMSFIWAKQDTIEELETFPLVKEIAEHVWGNDVTAFFDSESLQKDEAA